MKVLILVLTIFLSIFVFQQTTLQAKAQSTCDVSGNLLSQTSQEAALLGHINAYRAQNGVPALTWNSTLKKSAAWHTNDMSTHNSFSHTDSMGREAGTRIRDCGYNWTTYGENIQRGNTDPQVVFTTWKNSAPHNATMLSSAFREAGISSVNTYWTLDVGTGSSSSVSPTNPPSTVTPTILPSTTPSVTPQTSITPSVTEEPTPTPNIITDPTDTIVDVSIKINGVGEIGNKSPKHLTRQVAVGLYDQANKRIVSGNGFLKYDGKDLFRGEIHLGQLTNGIYTVKVASDFTLISQVIPQFQNLTSETVNTLPVVSLTQGDLIPDNTIDIDDYNLALICFQLNKCEFKDIIDFNDDGKADVIDYNLLLSSFRQYEGD